MTTNIKGLFIGVAALAATAAIAPAANAGCGMGAVKAPAAWRPAPDGAANPLFVRAAWGPPIVGMWSVTFTAGGNVIDFGYAQWHSDGTEIMNSGGRAPSTENFCLGAWAQTGALSYHLNHYALSYTPAGVLNAKVNIKEDVVVDPGGSSYAGPFTIDVYDPTGGTLLQHVAGRVVGRRVSAY